MELTKEEKERFTIPLPWKIAYWDPEKNMMLAWLPSDDPAKEREKLYGCGSFERCIQQIREGIKQFNKEARQAAMMPAV